MQIAGCEISAPGYTSISEQAPGQSMSWVKWLVLVIFFAIILSMASAMLHLVHDYRGESKRMVRALTWRIGLSITLFIVLWATWKLGWIEPRGTTPH